MLKNLQQHIVLWVRAKTGLTDRFFAWLAVAGGAAGDVVYFSMCDGL